MEAIRLYNQNGESFDCHPGVWSALLTVAKDHGWRPRGTVSAPDPLSLDPDPEMLPPDDYLSPKGQMVSRQDAEAAAKALEAAATDPSQVLSVPVLRSLIRVTGFCHSGPFLICEATGQVRSDHAETSEQLMILSQAIGQRSQMSADRTPIAYRRP